MTEIAKLHSTLADVPLSQMRVSPVAQRDLRAPRVADLLNQFDLEMLGYPVVNKRDAAFWIIDGQHRIEALKAFLGEWQSQRLTCRLYTGLTEREEAEMFDNLNNALPVAAFDKFKVRVRAGRDIEVAVKRATEKAGLKIALDQDEKSVSAVTTLVNVFKRSNSATLTRTLNIVHHAFGKPGLTAELIDGTARVCERYNGELKDDALVERLRDLRGGSGQLMTRAELLHKQTGESKRVCVAAAIVDVVNGKRGGKKLPSWWQEGRQ